MFDKKLYWQRRKERKRGQEDVITVKGNLFTYINRSRGRTRSNDPKHTKPYLLSRNDALYKTVKAAIKKRVQKREAVAKYYADARRKAK